MRGGGGMMVRPRMGGSRHPTAVLYGLLHPSYHRVHPGAVQDGGEERGSLAPELPRVSLHDREVGADELGEIHLVDNQELRAGDTRAAFTRHLVASGDIYYVYRSVN